jgi:pimeloyl-ACP methyl ester carboxylesterase
MASPRSCDPKPNFGYATTPTGQIHYCEMGEGPVLLLLHATSRSLRCYRRMMPLLAANFRTIAIDLPGWGNSHGLDGVEGIEGVAQCVADFLDAMKIPRAHLFGLHLGNKVGAALAARWPERVGDVILMGQTHSLIVDRARRDAEILKLAQHHFARDTASANGLELLQAWAACNTTVQALWWTKPLLKGDVKAANVDDARTRLADYFVGQPSLAKNYRSVFDFDMTAAFEAIQARALVIELLTRQEAHLGRQADAMCSRMRNASACYLEEADNMVLESRAGEVVDVIQQFLKAR